MTEAAALTDADRRIGTVIRLTAAMAEITMPNALAAAGRRGLAKGTVGDFVILDCDQQAVLGRIVETGIRQTDRADLDRQMEVTATTFPSGRIQMLASIDKTSQKVARGINCQPRIGDAVYLADGETLAKTLQDALTGGLADPTMIDLGTISGLENARISIPPEKLFGRHCGIFGATGGGKSWTLSRLVGEVARSGGKCILFDPTGEFAGRIPNAREFAFSRATGAQRLGRFPYRSLAEEDLRALLTPTAQAQLPMLRNAVKSLRMVEKLLDPDAPPYELTDHGTHWTFQVMNGQRIVGDIHVEQRGTILKAGKSRVAYGMAELQLGDIVGSEICNFDIHLLASQIRHECVDLFNRDDDRSFGPHDQRQFTFCSSLIIRLETYLNAPELACIFQDDGDDVCAAIEAFITDPSAGALVLSFKDVSFKYNTRELLLNAIGRYLLRRARSDAFRNTPVVCFLDEAHQFIGRSIGDEANRVTLDSFGLIAKEGRKYGLTLTLATQRPRDVPQDVLSQLGTLIVHRLTNEADRDTIEKACGEMDRSATAFIPALSQGEAIIVGPELPAPMPVQMTAPPPAQRPSSLGPDYQSAWQRVTDVAAADAS
ncbi:ATP-binding protein [Paracoccus sp. AK26]|uniref:ATP-binding protein n=1 Tax=Paracoccus sp. AK26 TaxID=2589076 RepID=UPI001428456F|nr:ATP-binding protein [Paracoccus sp. AK26]QIR84907.1 ATP-binding protein [Paracoccus sp. AK26]